ncbi:hypothetical protein ACFVH7_21230 [Kitasatospora indigofera]|uniref:hypothetical protein n=1 Tax=Kitasatospora indigofera TaxID=67307 RepID=UPI00363FC0B7
MAQRSHPSPAPGRTALTTGETATFLSARDRYAPWRSVTTRAASKKCPRKG